MDKVRGVSPREFGPGNPEFKVGQKVFIPFLKRKGTIDGIKSGLTIGSREAYDIILDEPLTMGQNDNRQSFDFDQVTKLQE